MSELILEPRPFAFAAGVVVALEISTTVYSLSAMLRSCYKLADRVASYVSPTEADTVFTVSLWSRRGGDLSQDVIGEFCIELADQELRERLARHVEPLRELIVTQAFAEGNLAGELDESDYEDDPLGIATSR